MCRDHWLKQGNTPATKAVPVSLATLPCALRAKDNRVARELVAIIAIILSFSVCVTVSED